MVAAAGAFLGSGLAAAQPAQAAQPPAATTPAPSPLVNEVLAKAVSPPAGDPQLLEVIVVPLAADRIPRALARRLEALLVAALERHGGFHNLTFAHLDVALAGERREELSSCADAGCAADIGYAIGADRILTGAVGRVGGEYTLTLRWIDARYGESLALIAAQVTGQEALVVATRRGAVQLLERAALLDGEAREQKMHPAYWTAEASLCFATRADPEPYSLGFGGAIRVGFDGWPGRVRGFIHIGAGLEFSYLYGKTAGDIGRIRYERAQLVPFAELRVAIPIANQMRTRLFVSGGAGGAYEIHHAHQGKGVVIDGESWAPEVRVAGGIWHHFSPHHSVFGNYRLRAQLLGDGADPLSELIAPGSTDATVYTHEIELGWAFHF